MSFSRICNNSQVVASRSQALSMHSQENVKKTRNPFALFVMDSQLFVCIRMVFLQKVKPNASKSLQMSYDQYKCLAINKNGLRLLMNML